MLTITNTTKAQIIALANAVLAALATFGIATQEQLGAVGLVVNAALALVVALTYKDSSMRLKQPRKASSA